MMKNRSFYERFLFAWNGIRSTWRSELSFKTEVTLGSGAVFLLFVLRPEPIWWAVVFVIIGAILSAELFNSALEKVLDKLHPGEDPIIGLAKDCAAAAVLVLSIASLVVLAALLYHCLF